MNKKNMLLSEILRKQPVMPILLIEQLNDAVPLARALVRGGIKSMEVTLRTPVALDCIRAIVCSISEAIVGAGTVLDSAQFESAEEAGAQFIVSPGLTEELLKKANDSKIPLLPGVITPSEIMKGREKGYNIFKFFPSEQIGGIKYLHALSSPFSGITFCPTGGINLTQATQWLTLSNVICVGGSWLAPRELIQARKWNSITSLANEAYRYL